MPAGIVWTDERIVLLKKLWGEGFSCSQIAMRIGSVSRCGVIGKIHRLGLSGRPTTHRKKTKPRRPKTRPLGWFKPASRIPIPTDPLPPPHISDVARVSFMELDESRHCKFVVGEPKGPYEPQFCGDERILGLPYCLAHAHRCYAPPQPKNRSPRPLPTPAIRLLEDA